MAVASLLVSLAAGLALASGSGSVTPRGYRLDLYPYPGDGVFKVVYIYIIC